MQKHNVFFIHLIIHVIYFAALPFLTDPAASDAALRTQICEDIFYSGFFSANFILCDLNDSNILHEIRNSTNLVDSSAYTNSFVERTFNHLNSHVFSEYTFLCPLKNWSNNRKYVFYVSREYNVSSFKELFKPGRFIHGTNLQGFLPVSHVLILAEEPMCTYMEPNFDLELQYLQMRKYIEPGEYKTVNYLVISVLFNAVYRIIILNL